MSRESGEAFAGIVVWEENDGLFEHISINVGPALLFDPGSLVTLCTDLVSKGQQINSCKINFEREDEASAEQLGAAIGQLCLLRKLELTAGSEEDEEHEAFYSRLRLLRQVPHIQELSFPGLDDEFFDSDRVVHNFCGIVSSMTSLQKVTLTLSGHIISFRTLFQSLAGIEKLEALDLEFFLFRHPNRPDFRHESWESLIKKKGLKDLRCCFCEVQGDIHELFVSFASTLFQALTSKESCLEAIELFDCEFRSLAESFHQGKLLLGQSKLRVLHVSDYSMRSHGCEFGQALCHFPCLQELQISTDCDDDDGDGQEFSILLTELQQSRSLKRLVLHDVWSTHWPIISPSIQALDQIEILRVGSLLPVPHTGMRLAGGTTRFLPGKSLKSLVFEYKTDYAEIASFIRSLPADSRLRSLSIDGYGDKDDEKWLLQTVKGNFTLAFLTKAHPDAAFFDDKHTQAVLETLLSLNRDRFADVEQLESIHRQVMYNPGNYQSASVSRRRRRRLA